jgi:hypothetical protein
MPDLVAIFLDPANFAALATLIAMEIVHERITANGPADLCLDSTKSVVVAMALFAPGASQASSRCASATELDGRHKRYLGRLWPESECRSRRRSAKCSIECPLLTLSGHQPANHGA